MWKRNFIETERGTFEYFIAGQGEPLAVTHLYSAYDERGNLFATPFTEHYTVYLINIRGAGNSDKVTTSNQHSIPETVKDVEAIRKALKIPKWGFAGHSAGGMIALQYAVDASSSLTKIIVSCSSASKDYAAHPSCIYCAENPNYPRMIEIMDNLNDKNTLIEERKKLGYEWDLLSFHSEDRLKEALTRKNSGASVGEKLDYFRKVEVKTYDLRDKLPFINIPCYIFAGRHDAQCPVKFSYEIAQSIPGSQLTVFELSNHHPYIEEEEDFAAVVKTTL